MKIQKKRGRFFAVVAAAIIAVAFLSSCDEIQKSLLSLDLGSSTLISGTANAGATSGAPGSNTAKVEYYFPRAGQKAQPQLISIINASHNTLDIAIYSLTDSEIGTAITQAHERGVTVRLITDREQSSGQYQKALLKKLVKAGIPVKINSHSGLMHLKVTVADQKIATTGSYNYTKSAEKTNDEVFVVLHDEKAAKDFDTEFETMWNDTKNFRNYK